MQAPQPIPVYRPTYLTDGQEFQGSLIESPANIFYQKVNASRATLDRMQFQWRSVSDNLLLSPVAMLRFQLKITCPQLWSQVLAYINIHGTTGANHASADFAAAPLGQCAGVNAATVGQLNVPSICFADGDAFTSCCSSINFVFNGTSLSLNRTNRYWRDFVRTQLASDDAAIIYKSAGGAYDKRDQRGVATILGANGDSRILAGIAQDSGVAERTRSLFALLRGATTELVTGQNAGGAGSSRILQVSYPIPVAPMNPWRGHRVANSCPYAKCPLAIPHLSAGSIDFLLEDFAKGFIRRLGDTQGAAGGVAAAASAAVLVGANTSRAPVQVELVGGGDKPYIELKYFRLSHTRALKESYRFNVWQAQTFLGPAPPTGVDANAGHAMKFGVSTMAIVGKDVASSGAANSASLISAAPANAQWSFQFDVINLAQIPSYLLISVPKLGETYSLEQSHADLKNSVRNLSTNLSIKSMKIIVNSARGAIDKSEDTTVGFIDAERLWQMTRENASSDYFKSGGFRAWRDYGCAVLLASPQFAPGLQACDGVAYPVQIQVEMVVENRAADVIANAQNGVVAGSRVAQIAADFIRAQAQVTAIFTKVVLSTTETSATTNALNYPLDAAERLMNAAGQRAY